MENDIDNGKLIESLAEVKLSQGEIRQLKKIILKNEPINFPKPLLKKFLNLFLLGLILAILMYVSFKISLKFSYPIGLMFLCIIIIFFRIISAKWLKDFILSSHIFFSSGILSFAAFIVFFDLFDVDLGLKFFILVFLIVLFYVFIYYIDEVYKILIIDFKFKKKFLAPISILALVIIIIYKSEYLILIFDSHPWLATVIMVSSSIVITYLLTRTKEREH